MKPKEPTGRQCLRALFLLKEGMILTPVNALQEGCGFRLSQRIIELSALGWEIEKGWFKTASGARVRTYRLA